MIYLIIKWVISATIIVLISEVAKRNSLLGSILASIPIVSVLAMIWLYLDTKNIETIAILSRDIFWLVIPSLILFLSLPILLKLKFNFYTALLIACALTSLGYTLTIILLQKLQHK